MVSQNEVAKAQQLGYNDAISKVKMKDNNVLTANGHSSPTLEVSADLEKALVSLGVNDAASFGDEALALLAGRVWQCDGTKQMPQVSDR